MLVLANGLNRECLHFMPIVRKLRLFLLFLRLFKFLTHIITIIMIHILSYKSYLSLHSPFDNLYCRYICL